MYKVITDFSDMEDSGFVYREGDVYPRKGKEFDEKRAAVLASSSNRRGFPLIAKVDEPREEEGKKDGNVRNGGRVRRNVSERGRRDV